MSDMTSNSILYTPESHPIQLTNKLFHLRNSPNFHSPALFTFTPQEEEELDSGLAATFEQVCSDDCLNHHLLHSCNPITDKNDKRRTNVNDSIGSSVLQWVLLQRETQENLPEWLPRATSNSSGNNSPPSPLSSPPLQQNINHNELHDLESFEQVVFPLSSFEGLIGTHHLSPFNISTTSTYLSPSEPSYSEIDDTLHSYEMSQPGFAFDMVKDYCNYSSDFGMTPNMEKSLGVSISESMQEQSISQGREHKVRRQRRSSNAQGKTNLCPVSGCGKNYWTLYHLNHHMHKKHRLHHPLVRTHRNPRRVKTNTG